MILATVKFKVAVLNLRLPNDTGATALGAVISLFVRFRQARGDERQQIKWFASASVLSLVFIFAWNFLLDAEGVLLQSSLALISLTLAPAIPVATGIAILNYRLYDIDRLITVPLSTDLSAEKEDEGGS